MTAGKSVPALTARGVSFSYSKSREPALRDFSLDVEEGCCLGLLGTNGSGKTTFVSLVCGLLKPDMGEISVFSRPAGSFASRQRLGLCPQELALYPTLNARENLQLFGRLAGIKGAKLRQRVDYCLELAQLVEEQKQRVSSYSGGMKRRLNLAASLVHDPGLLLLDEPTVGVDPQSRIALQESLEELIASGTTILYTSHYLEEVERLCDRVVVIDRGVHLIEGPTEEIVGQGKQAATFLLQLNAGRDARTIAAEVNAGGLLANVLEDDRLELLGNDLAELTAVVAKLAERGDIAHCETHKPSLEESFLGLTGRELRDR